MTERGHISLGMKLAALFHLRQIRCVHCGDPIEDPADTEWDHMHALCFDGPHSAENLGPAHVYCHGLKSRADTRARAKIRRLRGDLKPKACKTIRSRGFDRSHTRKFNGQVVAREG